MISLVWVEQIHRWRKARVYSCVQGESMDVWDCPGIVCCAGRGLALVSIDVTSSGS
ncbi:hypothetical protein QP992_04640 [Corynebacterium ulcerans]|uniref:hypothetical protein n=1 Tax=Corynebacterium ulcerans TaxID=65058 RepID=UPI0018D775E4|nr:hypothetical protein [Corynebacterium ulcerans]MBH5295349.1 hypothetical protein [Corynebacterium ulcerans]MBH5302934.1 hypothetical protein [Corynebacterium ulcerans]MDK8888426.1 hypothetical protein [Corynebacterium ulcerans]